MQGVPRNSDLLTGLESLVAPNVASPDIARVAGAWKVAAAVALDRRTTDILADALVEAEARVGQIAAAASADCGRDHGRQARKR